MDKIDVLELFISCAVKLQSKRLDARMSICLIIKMIYFLLWFIYGGEERFTGSYYAIYLLVWAVFHLYIIVIEFPYIREGINNQYWRKICYKVEDFIQCSILLIYFFIQVYKYDISDFFYLFSINTLIVDAAMNIDQIIKFLQGNKEQLQNIKVEGGESLFYLALIVGCIIAFILCLASYIAVPKSSNQTFPFQPWVFIFSLIGEGAFIFYIGTEFSSHAQGPFFAKNILMIVYGLAIGIFNYYYAAILGMYAVIKIVSWFIEKYQECKGDTDKSY